MAWCPRCRINYPSDVIICSDCGAALVEELPEEFVQLAKEANVIVL